MATTLIDLRASLGPLLLGRDDPTCRFVGDTFWMTAATPEGPASARVNPSGEAEVFGDGSDWLLRQVPDLLGARDDSAGFHPHHDVIDDQWRRHRLSYRQPRTALVWQTAVMTVLSQRVTGLEAKRAWQALHREVGAPAPGPVPPGMFVTPTPERALRIPSWDWRRWGVDHQRRDTIRTVASASRLLDRSLSESPAAGRELLTRIPGVGAWTAAEVAFRALGDPDAVSVGDYHLAATVTYALTGRRSGTDEDMVGLLEGYLGQRYRAIRMIELAGVRVPRRGPRMSLPPRVTG